MKIRSMRKILSSFVIAVYFMVYTAPFGLCVANVPQIDAGVVKPVLRGTTATPAKPKATTTPSTPSSLKLEGDISITKGNPKISLSLRDSDVKQVLRMFADKAGLNIVFHSSVDGTVTLDLVNVPLNDAFKLVMQVSDLTYYVDHNTMVVASAKVAQTLNLSKQEMVSIPVKYTDAAIMADFLNKNIFTINKPGLSNSQVAITNPATNEVLIFGTDNDVRMARKIISKFDVKPQVTTYVVNHTTPKEMANLICNIFIPPVASSSQGSSSSSSSTGGGGSSGSGTDLSLGGGVVACQYNNKVTTDALASFNAKSMIISYSPQLGTISVTGGSSEQLEMIKDYIAKNDKKQPQAYLEVSIIELSESGTREFDNTWQLWSNNFAATFNGEVASNPIYPTFFQGDTYNVVDPSDPTKVKYAISKFTGTPTITYAINYIVKNGKGRVLANPRIMITNGQQSTIDLTSDYIKQVTSQIVTSTTSATPTVQRTYTIGSDEGIKVDLTPFISPDGYVTLNVKPNYSTIKEKVTALGPDGKTMDLVATLLQRRNLDLKNIRIKDGDTLVLAGMNREEETKTIAKVPVLGDLPGVGFFFRNTTTTKAKEELVIMLTPKIIKDSDEVVNNSDVNL